MPSTAQLRKNFGNARYRLWRDATEPSLKDGGRFACPMFADGHQLDPRFAPVGNDHCLASMGQVPECFEPLHRLSLGDRSHSVKIPPT
jgi:hypothetical protein